MASCEVTVTSTGSCAGTVMTGGLSEPPERIVKVAGMRALTGGEGVVLVALAEVVDVVVVVVAGAVADVCADVVEVVVVAGGAVAGALLVGDVVVAFEPPQLDSTRALRRMATLLTFAG